MGWLLSAANRDRFGGPYLIIKLTRVSLKKGQLPSASRRSAAFTRIQALRTVMRTLNINQPQTRCNDTFISKKYAPGGADAQPGQISTNTQEWSGLVAYNGFAAGTDTASMPIAAG